MAKKYEQQVENYISLMKHLIAAIEFITILPLGKSTPFDPKGMIPYFPVAGLLLGIMVSVFDYIALQLWSKPVASVLDVVLLVVLTGAFHLDGLGDAADGLLGHRSREAALEIMKDSRIGAMGLVAVISTLAVKWGGIGSLDAHRHLLLVIIPAYARGSMIFGIRFLQYGRPGGGTGHDFFGGTPNLKDFLGMIVPVLLSFFLGWKCIVLNTAFLTVTGILLAYYKKRMGCITGDMLGAMTEITESMLFLVIAIGVF